MSGILGNFSKAISDKCAEVERLKIENQELRRQLEGKPLSTVSPTPAMSYAKVVSQPGEQQPRQKRTTTQPVVTQANVPENKKLSRRKALEKCQDTRTNTRFVVDIPENMTVSQVKADLWQTVSGKLPNPRAKTIVKGRTITVLPDDKSTLEVLSRIPNIRSEAPRQPRVIVYDVDDGISEMQLASAIMEQNPELGLTQDDVESVMVKFKLEPRDRGTTHWVLETPAEVLNKIENKSVFLGLMRCRIRVHQNIPQCYKCQNYGHTSLGCNQESPTCRHCAGSHDSRECTTKDASRCSNCKGDHKASSEACKAKSQAIRGLLRRMDFGSK